MPIFATASHRLKTEKVRQLFVEACCEPTSNIGTCTPPDCICLRLTKDVDLTCITTVQETIHVLREAAEAQVPIFIWVAVPCTAGCRLKHLNDAIGVQTGDPETTSAFIDNSIEICRVASELGGSFAMA